MTQGLSSVLMLPHLRCPSRVKRCWRLRELVTHILPFCPSSRDQPQPSSKAARNPQALTVHHSKDTTLFASPEVAVKKGRLLWVPAFTESTRYCSHTNSNADEMSVPSTSLPFQADPAAS